MCVCIVANKISFVSLFYFYIKVNSRHNQYFLFKVINKLPLSTTLLHRFITREIHAKKIAASGSSKKDVWLEISLLAKKKDEDEQEHNFLGKCKSRFFGIFGACLQHFLFLTSFPPFLATYHNYHLISLK